MKICSGRNGSLKAASGKLRIKRRDILEVELGRKKKEGSGLKT